MNIIVIGAGGHSKVVIDALQCAGENVLGVTKLDNNDVLNQPLDIPILGTDAIIEEHDTGQVHLANGLDGKGREQIFNNWKRHGYHFCQVIHPSAVIASSAHLGEGVQIMAGAVVQSMVTVGDNSLINTKASIDHDCVISKHSHIAPGTTLCGDVHVGERCHMGAGCVVIEGLTIGADVFVAAGATVCRNIASGACVGGTSARSLR